MSPAQVKLGGPFDGSRAKRLLFALIFFFLSLIFARPASAAITIDQYGNVMVFESQGEVLSKGSGNGDDNGDSSGSGSSGSNDDDDDSSGSSGSGSSGSDSSGSSGTSGSGSGSGSSDTTKTRTSTPGGTQIRTEVKDGEIRTETRLPSGIKIKTREEEGRTRTDIYEGGTKLRLERRDDRVVVKLENEEGEELEVPGAEEEEILKIEQRPGQVVRVESLGRRFVVSSGELGAQTNFPLTVNLQTNELVVNTPAGERVVTVLPDQAVQNMLAANVIDQIRGLPFTQAVWEATEAASFRELINLITTREGILAYEIPGLKNERFLGFIPVDIAKTAVVSAETGEVLQVQQGILSTVLDLLSF